jgi:ABC transporter related
MLITAKNVVKKFDKFTALNHFNMNVPEGSIYGLVGPNGSGKTTTIKHLIGMYKQDEGEVLVNNEKVYDNEKVKSKIAYISDDLYFFHGYSIKDMAKFYSKIYKNFSFEKFNDLQKVFNIDVKRKVNKLSKGMKKQVAFWLTISCNPEILVLDEPIDGLDPIMKENVWKILLEEVQKRKMTVIISSHNLKELENVCTNIGIMKNGEMTLEKELEEQDNNIQKIQVVFSNNEEIEKIKEKLQMLKEEKIGSVYYFIVKGKQKEIEEKLKEYNLTLMEFLPLSLEEVFMFENGGEANV